MSDQVVRLAFPAKAEYLILARLSIAGIFRAVPVDEVALADLKLAVTEVCANAVNHAYPEAPGQVRMVFEVGDDSISVSVEDDGVGFDLASLEERALATEPMTEGMGIPLVRAIADDVSVGPGASGGTVVCFTKRLPRGPAAPA